MAKDALGHGSNGRGRKPIPGHPYHAKTDAELRYIVKDASEAAQAAQGMGKLETKYNDQINDAATVLGYRARGGQSDAPSDQLNSGPKSDAAPVHDSMAAKPGYNEHGSRHGYNPGAVNDAIASQNRSGRGKIGGREAKAIHALLKGR
jgi:hypothetical protein